jgi:Skp family chaperone for outer membrane proteins
MKDILEEIPLDHLQRMDSDWEKKRDAAKAQVEKAEKELDTAANKYSIYNRMLVFRRQREEEKNSAPKVSTEVDKTAAILEFVRNNGATGVLPKDIEAALRESGMDLKAGYVHAILSRLKKRDQLRSHGGKYFPNE